MYTEDTKGQILSLPSFSRRSDQRCESDSGKTIDPWGISNEADHKQTESGGFPRREYFPETNHAMFPRSGSFNSSISSCSMQVCSEKYLPPVEENPEEEIAIVDNARNRYSTEPWRVILHKQAISDREEQFNVNKQAKYPFKTVGVPPQEHHYRGETISRPIVQYIVYSIAAVLQSEVMTNNANLDSSVAAQFPEFYMESFSSDVIPVLPTEEKDSDGQYLLGYAAFEYMFQFISYIHKRCCCQPECLIVALIYVNRVTSTSELKINAVNWRNLWASCVIISQKMWDDRSFSIGAYSTVLTGIPKKSLRNLEHHILKLISFDIGIKASLYARYYFELRHMHRTFFPQTEPAREKDVVAISLQGRQVEERSKNRKLVKREKSKRPREKHDTLYSNVQDTQYKRLCATQISEKEVLIDSFSICTV